MHLLPVHAACRKSEALTKAAVTNVDALIGALPVPPRISKGLSVGAAILAAASAPDCSPVAQMRRVVEIRRNMKRSVDTARTLLADARKAADGWTHAAELLTGKRNSLPDDCGLPADVVDALTTLSKAVQAGVVDQAEARAIAADAERIVTKSLLAIRESEIVVERTASAGGVATYSQAAKAFARLADLRADFTPAELDAFRRHEKACNTIMHRKKVWHSARYMSDDLRRKKQASRTQIGAIRQEVGHE